MMMCSYPEFRERIVNMIRNKVQTGYYQELQLRVLNVADDLLYQTGNSSIESYRNCIFEAIRLSEFPSLLFGLHSIVNEVYSSVKK